MVRIKERYLLVNIQYPEAAKPSPTIPDIVVWNQPTSSALTPDKLVRAIRTKVRELFGTYGAGCVETIMVKYLSTATSTFILRINRTHYRIVWTALTLMNQLPLKNSGGPACIFNVVRVCGTIKKAEEEAIRRARTLILAANDYAVAAQGEGGRQQGALDTIFGGPDPKRRTRAGAVDVEMGGVIDSDVDDSDKGMIVYD